MAKNKKPNVAAYIAASFTVISSAIIVLLIMKIVSFEMGMLMLVASVGMHLGFGVLIFVYRLVGKLE